MQTLSRAFTASRWDPSIWFSDWTEMSHDSRWLFAYSIIAFAAKEKRIYDPQRSDAGALVACFQASEASLRSRANSGHGVCAWASTASPTSVTIVKADSLISVIG